MFFGSGSADLSPALRRPDEFRAKAIRAGFNVFLGPDTLPDTTEGDGMYRNKCTRDCNFLIGASKAGFSIHHGAEAASSGLDLVLANVRNSIRLEAPMASAAQYVALPGSEKGLLSKQCLNLSRRRDEVSGPVDKLRNHQT